MAPDDGRWVDSGTRYRRRGALQPPDWPTFDAVPVTPHPIITRLQRLSLHLLRRTLTGAGGGTTRRALDPEKRSAYGVQPSRQGGWQRRGICFCLSANAPFHLETSHCLTIPYPRSFLHHPRSTLDSRGSLTVTCTSHTVLDLWNDFLIITYPFCLGRTLPSRMVDVVFVADSQDGPIGRALHTHISTPYSYLRLSDFLRTPLSLLRTSTPHSSTSSCPMLLLRIAFAAPFFSSPQLPSSTPKNHL